MIMSNPFTPVSANTFKAYGELGVLELIAEWVSPVAKSSPFGPGDDAALIHYQGPQGLLTADSLVYGVHFDETATPQQAGAKLLKRNLSDIAAMGGCPSEAVVSLFLHDTVDVFFLKGFYEGLIDCASEWGVSIVGGDITGVPMPFFGASMSLLGSVDIWKTRLGGRVGDSVWVTGELGGSLMGHHLTFQPRLLEGAFLTQHPGVKAMMDLTDGLAKDGLAICEKDKSLSLLLDKLPIRPDAVLMSQASGRLVIDHALSDGEDYELLFVMDAAVDPVSFKKNWEVQFNEPVTCIGYLSPLLLQDTPYLCDASDHSLLSFKGYEH